MGGVAQSERVAQIVRTLVCRKQKIMFMVNSYGIWQMQICKIHTHNASACFPSLESLPDLPRLVTVAKPRLVCGDFQAWLSEGSIGSSFICLF